MQTLTGNPTALSSPSPVLAALVVTLLAFGDLALAASRDDESSLPAWSAEKASIAFSLEHLTPPYKARILYDPSAARKPARIEILVDGEVVFWVQGHLASVFQIAKGVLYFADYSRGSSGCEIIAYDLEKREARWRAAVRPAGLIFHSMYSNYVNLNVSGSGVMVLGHESAADYVARLSIEDGTVIELQTTPARRD